MAAKVAGGVVLCTVLWDASFWIGNPFAVPGITDNLVLSLLSHQKGCFGAHRETFAAIEGSLPQGAGHTCFIPEQSDVCMSGRCAAASRALLGCGSTPRSR